MRWVPMVVQSIEGRALILSGDGVIAPLYASVEPHHLDYAEMDEILGADVLVEIDSDDYPVTVDYEGARIWPYPQ